MTFPLSCKLFEASGQHPILFHQARVTKHVYQACLVCLSTEPVYTALPAVLLCSNSGRTCSIHTFSQACVPRYHPTLFPYVLSQPCHLLSSNNTHHCSLPTSVYLVQVYSDRSTATEAVQDPKEVVAALQPTQVLCCSWD